MWDGRLTGERRGNWGCGVGGRKAVVRSFCDSYALSHSTLEYITKERLHLVLESTQT